MKILIYKVKSNLFNNLVRLKMKPKNKKNMEKMKKK